MYLGLSWPLAYLQTGSSPGLHRIRHPFISRPILQGLHLAGQNIGVNWVLAGFRQTFLNGFTLVTFILPGLLFTYYLHQHLVQ
jgi:hypothetical protein